MLTQNKYVQRCSTCVASKTATFVMLKQLRRIKGNHSNLIKVLQIEFQWYLHVKGRMMNESLLNTNCCVQTAIQVFWHRKTFCISYFSKKWIKPISTLLKKHKRQNVYLTLHQGEFFSIRDLYLPSSTNDPNLKWEKNQLYLFKNKSWSKSTAS